MDTAHIHTMLECAGMRAVEIQVCGAVVIVRVEKLPTWNRDALERKVTGCGGRLYGYGTVIEFRVASPYVMVGRVA